MWEIWEGKTKRLNKTERDEVDFMHLIIISSCFVSSQRWVTSNNLQSTSLIAFNMLKSNLAQIKLVWIFLPQGTILFCFEESEFGRLNLSLNELSTFFSVVQHSGWGSLSAHYYCCWTCVCRELLAISITYDRPQHTDLYKFTIPTELLPHLEKTESMRKLLWESVK